MFLQIYLIKYEYAVQWESKNTDNLYSQLLAIENPYGQSDVNYISEITLTLDYIRYLHVSIPNIKVNQVYSIHNSHKNHTDSIQSFKVTGQFNCDLKMIYDINHYRRCTAYMDIKQTESKEFDYQYLKLIYLDNNDALETYTRQVYELFPTITQGNNIMENLNIIHAWFLENEQPFTLVFTRNIAEINLSSISDQNALLVENIPFSTNKGFNKSVVKIFNTSENRSSFDRLKAMVTSEETFIQTLDLTRSKNLKYLPDFIKDIDNTYEIPH